MADKSNYTTDKKYKPVSLLMKFHIWKNIFCCGNLMVVIDLDL